MTDSRSARTYLCISGVVFGLVAVAHLSRLIYRWPIQIGSWPVPHWASIPGLVVSGILSTWGFTLASKRQAQ